MRPAHVRAAAVLIAVITCGCSVEVERPAATLVPEITHGASTPDPSATRVPVTWAHLQLTGKLVYLSSTMEDGLLTGRVQQLDLASGEIKTLISVSPGWIHYATVSPDAQTLVMSFSPPRQSGSASSRSLYVTSPGASAPPQPLFPPPAAADRYTQAEWSPDGRHIYYVHYNQDELAASQFFEDYDIFRMAYPPGEHERLLEHAFWPRLSPDSARLVYIALDPETGDNELFIANADGSQPQPVPLSGAQQPQIVDAPLFLPDGKTLLFSAPEPPGSYIPDSLEQWTGVRVARAHSVPSDWWSVPVTGGAPTRLTTLKTINLFASLSPDRRHIASLSGDGIFVMDLDGSNLTRLLSDSRVHGTVSWIP